MIERRKMTRATYQALKRYILLEREKKKQEQEQDKAQEQLRRERELRRKKEEEDSLTLEQTKEQLLQLEQRLAELKKEKHGLFSELKKVLHQENEIRQRETERQMKEQNEMAVFQQQQYATNLQSVPGHPGFLQTHIVQRPTSKYLNIAGHPPVAGQGIKRSRSPSPSPAAHYPSSHYPGQFASTSSYSGGSHGHIKQEPYVAASEYGKIPKTEPSSYSSGYGQPAASHPGYQPPAHPVSQQYQTTTSQPVSGSGKYPPSTIASPSAFSSFPPMSAGYVYQQPGSKPPSLTAEQYAGYIRPQSLPRHHTPQSGYASPHHGAGSAGVPAPGQVTPLQQQLEHASQKAGFVDDKYKPRQQALLTAGPVPQRGSIVSGYPVHPQQPGLPTSLYTGATNTGGLPPPRHNSHGQNRY